MIQVKHEYKVSCDTCSHTEIIVVWTGTQTHYGESKSDHVHYGSSLYRGGWVFGQKGRNNSIHCKKCVALDKHI